VYNLLVPHAQVSHPFAPVTMRQSAAQRTEGQALEGEHVAIQSAIDRKLLLLPRQPP